MTMTIDPRLHRIIAAQPYPLLFATISGAHLYGFPSPDSDFDLRGAHVLPLERVVELDVRDGMASIANAQAWSAIRPAESVSGAKPEWSAAKDPT
jgi:hypothetical protein